MVPVGNQTRVAWTPRRRAKQELARFKMLGERREAKRLAPADPDQTIACQRMPYSRMQTETDHRPGELAPDSGQYSLLNVFGSMSSEAAQVLRGNRLPPAPRGFTWRMVSKKEQRGD
jgi:hypothetical protein